MKNVFKRLPKKAYVAVATLALVAGVASSAIAGFGPDRPTRVWSDGLNGFDHVTFNSFTGVPLGIGDERDFLRGVQVGRDSVWSDPVNGVDNDAEVEVKIYIHNNASSTLNDAPGNPGIAKDVTVRAELPAGLSQSQQITSYISASNAQPREIYDTLDLTGANSGFFGLDYIAGSAKMFDHNTGQTTAIGDNLVTTGVKLPNQKGCFEYVREITFRVKVKMPSYATQKTARLKGEDSTKWRKVVNAKAGDEVEWRIWFKNSGTSNLTGVKLVDQLPSYTTVVGNVEMDKGANTVVYGNDAVQNNGRQVNIDIGDFHPGDDAYVYITTKIQNAKQLECGVHQIANTAYTTPDGLGALNDSASVNVFGKEDCEKPENPSYVCESLTVEKLGGRKVRVTVKAPAAGGATFKNVTINYGDGSQAKVTTNLVDEYEYQTDGTFKITATVTFTVNGADKSVSSDACTATVSFDSEKPVTPTPEPELPKTGAGSLIGLFAATSVAGGVAHNVVTRRRNG